MPCNFTKTIRKLRLIISILQLLINFRGFIRFIIRVTIHNFKRIKKLLTNLTTVELFKLTPTLTHVGRIRKSTIPTTGLVQTFRTGLESD